MSTGTVQKGPAASKGAEPSAAAGVAAATPWPDPSSVLLSISAAELHEVSGGKQQLVERGPLVVYCADADPSAAPVAKLPRLPVPPATPATAPTRPPAKESLYPEVHQSAYNSSDEEGGAGGSRGRRSAPSSRIVLAIGGRSWELLPASQTLKAGELTFVFNLPGQEAFFYTVVLASDVEPEAVGMLEAVLEGTTIYRESEALLGDEAAAAGEAALAERAYRSGVARGVHRASRALAGGLLATATYASGTIRRGAAYLTPAEPTATPVQISPGLKQRLAAKASSLVNSAVTGLAWAGSKVAGGVLWLTGADKPLQAGEEAGVLREVGQAAVVGFNEVWDSMEEAGRLVLVSARDSTTSAVRQRWGDDAAEVSTHSMTAAGHSVDTYFAARKLGVKTVAKSAAKKTAKGVIHKWAGHGPESASASGSATSSRSSSRSGVGAPAKPGGGAAGSSDALAEDTGAKAAL